MLFPSGARVGCAFAFRTNKALFGTAEGNAKHPEKREGHSASGTGWWPFCPVTHICCHLLGPDANTSLVVRDEKERMCGMTSALPKNSLRENYAWKKFLLLMWVYFSLTCWEEIVFQVWWSLDSSHRNLREQTRRYRDFCCSAGMPRSDTKKNFECIFLSRIEADPKI